MKAGDAAAGVGRAGRKAGGQECGRSAVLYLRPAFRNDRQN